jgi:alkylation response protein AidB-like acyl-CoA dehydrogenase
MGSQQAASTTVDELQAFGELARSFALEELAPKREKSDRYPFGEQLTDAIGHAADAGFFGVNLPVEYGGAAAGAAALAAILQDLSRVDASMAAVMLTNAAACDILNQASREADGAELYRTLAGALPLAFPTFTGLREAELPLCEGMTLTGRLAYLPLGGLSRYAILPARSSNGASLSYYGVDIKGPGVAVSAPVVSLGLHACPAADVIFERASVRMIGMPGAASRYFAAMQSRMSVAAAAISLGILEGSFGEGLQYTKDRFQGGRQIIDWSEVRMILAGMAVEISVAQSCLESACRAVDANAPGWEQRAHAAALHIGELACRATVDGVQLLGGNGYMKDFGQEKRMRDAKQAQCLLGMPLVRKIDFIGRIVDAS